MFRRALAGREAVLGATHPDTLKSVSWLATLLAYRIRRDCDFLAICAFLGAPLSKA